MKRTIFLPLLLLLVANQAKAQGASLAKSAGKALTTYNMDRANNGNKLDEAKTKILEALQYPEAQAMASVWITKGDIYSTIIENDMAKRIFNQSSSPLTGDNDALVAFQSYKKGFEIAEKKFEKSDAIKGIAIVEGHLVNIGVEKYQASLFEKAFFSFQAALQSHDILSSNGQKSVLDDSKQREDIMLFTAKCAQMANLNSEAIGYYETLYKAGTDKAEVYEALYSLKAQKGDEVGANNILKEGRNKFPNDAALLFAEINDYLKKGKLEELISRLNEAIKQEPNNVGLYVTLGNVYDNLYQGEMRAQNADKADAYFKEAEKNYHNAQEKDPNNMDAAYSLGSLFYNKAAFLIQKLNSLPNDNASEVMQLFDTALPYFQKAETLNPNDLNTLIALSEIYARKEDTDKSNEFKKRLETVKSGDSNKNSYFKK